MVLTRMLICVTDRPIKAGAISQPIRRTPSWAKSNRQPKRSPAWRRAGIWLRNWASPPMTTPTATARIGSANSGARRKAAAMIAMLNSTGENAGAAKLRTEFSTPIASGAEQARQHHVACEAEDAAEERGEPDDAGGLDDLGVFGAVRHFSAGCGLSADSLARRRPATAP